MIRIIFNVLFFLLIIFAQFVLGKHLNILGVFPNIVLITIVFLAMSKGRFEACLAGFMFIFAMRMLIFTLIGYFVGLASRNFDKNQIYAQVLGVFLANIAYWGGLVAVYYAFAPETNNISSLVFTLRNFLSFVLTILITPFVFLFFRILDAAFKPRRY